MNDEFSRDGRCDEGAVGGALDLLDGVDGGGGDDGGAMLLDGGDGAVDGGLVDKRTNGIVYEDDVLIACRWKCGERIGDRLLAIVAADDDMDLSGELVLGQHGGDPGLLRLADGNVDSGNGRYVEEGTERVDQDGKTFELEKLLGDGCGNSSGSSMGHAGADAGCGDDDKYGHGNRSITLRAFQL